MLYVIFNKIRNHIQRILLLSFFPFCLSAQIEESHANRFQCFLKGFYWYTNETIDWAFVNSLTSNTVQSKYKTFVFDWAPGFTLGMGYGLNHDLWDLQAGYTWFQSHANDHATGSVTSGFLAARLSLLEPFATGKASMDIHYSMFDCDIGRKFFIRKNLCFRPSIGLKGGWIDQSIHSHWTKQNVFGFFSFTASENLKQKFNAAGAKTAVTGSWDFSTGQNHTMSLISSFAISYLWGYWSIQDQFTDDLSNVIDLKTSNRNMGSLVFYNFIGLGWNYKLNQKQIELNLGYEIEDWLNQCQFFTDISGSQSNDLILQGFNLSLNFSF